MSSTINIPAGEPENDKNFLLGVICLLISGAIITAGLWPFEFNPTNKVEWVQNGEGIRFFGQGIVFSPEPLKILDTTSKDSSVAIEIQVRPHTETNNIVASILTLYNGNQEQFILGQWKRELIIRIPSVQANSRKRYREIAARNALIKDITHHITVTSSKDKTDIYVDGKLKKSAPHYSLFPENHALSGYLILGNSPEGTHPWYGTYLGLALYNYALNGKEVFIHYRAWQQDGNPLFSGEKKPIAYYPFNEHTGQQIRDHSGAQHHFLIPATFQPLRRAILGVPRKDEWTSRWNLSDVSINILGFVPFGFILSAWLQHAKKLDASRVFGFSILIGLSLSLAIELTQALIPTRDSSLMDVLSNTIGTALGSLLLRYAVYILTMNGRLGKGGGTFERIF